MLDLQSIDWKQNLYILCQVYLVNDTVAGKMIYIHISNNNTKKVYQNIGTHLEYWF